MSNSIEMIKAFHSIKSFLNEQDQKLLVQKLGLTKDDLEIRMKGKDDEIEFILMLYLLRSCKNMVGFEEGVSALTGTYTPDLLVELQNGEKIFIEIKSTNEKKYKISKGNFDNRVKFTKDFGYPLYFAIKLKGFWMLFDSDYMLSRHLKIDISCFKYSKLDKITGNRKFAFPKELRISTYYSKSSNKNIGIGFEPYGKLVKYSLFFGDKLLFTIDKNSEKQIGLTFLLEGLQDSMSNQEQKISHLSEDITQIEEKFIREYTQIDSGTLLQAPIKHILNDNGNMTDLNAYFRDIASSTKRNLIFAEKFHEAIFYLIELGVPILEVKGEFIYSHSQE